MKRQLPRSPEDIEKRRAAFLAGLRNESDRGCVLVAAAALDEALEMVLRGHMPQEKAFVRNVVDPLFVQNGPLATFWARIRLAFALGYIEAETFEDLEVVRQLRNRFAHQYTAASFDVPDVQALVAKLTTVDLFYEYVRSSRRRRKQFLAALDRAPTAAEGERGTPVARWNWCVASSWILALLESATEGDQPAITPTDR